MPEPTLPPEAHPLSDLTIWAALLIRKLNPATVVIEEAAGFLTSGAGFMMRIFLERAGYIVEARVIDPRDYGELSARIRSVIVAHSGSNFCWPAPISTTRTFAEIRDDESELEDHYFTPQTKPWLTDHWSKQAAKGNGFISTQLDNESSSVPCISKRYFCNLNQFFAAIGSNYLPQVQTKPSNFASPLVCDSCFGTIKLPKVQIGT